MSNNTNGTLSTKKAFQELVDFLQKNESKKVSTLMEQILEMTKQKASSKTYLVDKAGNVVAIFCYYHKQWELLSETEYGAKASSSTGYNTMCKKGVSLWTKQNNTIKSIGEQVLTMLEEGTIEASEISDTKEKLVVEARTINETDMPSGYSLEVLCETFEVKGDETLPKPEKEDDKFEE